MQLSIHLVDTGEMKTHVKDFTPIQVNKIPMLDIIQQVIFKDKQLLMNTDNKTYTVDYWG